VTVWFLLTSLLVHSFPYGATQLRRLPHLLLSRGMRLEFLFLLTSVFLFNPQLLDLGYIPYNLDIRDHHHRGANHRLDLSIAHCH